MFLFISENAKDLTEMGKGKHHIGDFLPPEELEKFIETVKATKEDRPPGTTETSALPVCVYTCLGLRCARFNGKQSMSLAYTQDN